MKRRGQQGDVTPGTQEIKERKMRANKIKPAICRMRRWRGRGGERRRSCRRGSSSSMWTPAVIKVGREESREDEHKLRHKSEEDTTLNAASGEKRKKRLIVS